MKHIRLWESTGPLFRELTSHESVAKVGHLHVMMPLFDASNDAREWLSSLMRDDLLQGFGYQWYFRCSRNNVLDPVTPRQAEHVVNLITTHGDLAVSYIMARPYGINLHKDPAIEAFIRFRVDRVKGHEIFTLDGLDVEVCGLEFADKMGRPIWVYFHSDDYILVMAFGRFLWCDGVAGLLQGLDSII